MGEDREEPSGGSRGSGTGWGVDWKGIGEYAIIGLVFPLAMLVGYLLGRWVGGYFGYERAGAAVGLLLGIVAAFYNLYEVVRRLDARDRERGGGSGPPRA
ncbi:MAG: AtpZ/AtpI family protein [bacterium]